MLTTCMYACRQKTAKPGELNYNFMTSFTHFT